MSSNTNITITAAKGRPMLTWVGKRPLRSVTAFPAQHIETFDPEGRQPGDTWTDWPEKYPQGGLLFHGDNKEVLAHLLANGFRGKVKLIYIDPPFDSGADYVRKVQLRGVTGTAKLDGENYTLGEQIQYTDIWANDNYLQFMYERLLLLKELLDVEHGFIAVHCDWRKSHHLRCLMDEVFGAENFRAEILVRAGTKNVQSQFEEVSALTIGNNSVFLYSKSRDEKLRKLSLILDKSEPGKWDTFWRGTDRPTLRYELLGQTPSSGQWRWRKERAEMAVESYNQYKEWFAHTMSLDDYYLNVLDQQSLSLDFVRKDEGGTLQYYVPPRNYKLLSNVWFDISYRGAETDYPTEKHEEPLVRLVEWLTHRGDLVLDSFLGSGTTAAVAQKLGRRWIGCDINKGAIQTTSKRLQTIISEQLEAGRARKSQGMLEMDGAKEPAPAQTAFTVWRVNDYDLQIQHNEAVNLACEHIGVERTRTDSFFDGTQGGRLVKIIPFGHPLSPLDLEELRRELDSRPDEDRNILVVCLGKELSADAWLEDWNRLRKGANTVNKIDVIELRTDPKYGKFLIHQPAEADVDIRREGDSIRVEVRDFISPTIIERLQIDANLLQAKVSDWRSMVDCIMIDTAYNGEVFNVSFSDIPEKKTDLVKGLYELSAPAGDTIVAVKIIDMLGEEVVIVHGI